MVDMSIPHEMGELVRLVPLCCTHQAEMLYRFPHGSACGFQPRELGADGIEGRADRRLRIVAQREVMLVSPNGAVPVAGFRRKAPFVTQARGEEWLPSNEVRSIAQRGEGASPIAGPLPKPAKRDRGVIQMPVACVKLRHAGAHEILETIHRLARRRVPSLHGTHRVDRIAKVCRDSDGDLRAVSAALIDLPEAWSDGARKFRTPQDWLVAVMRAFNAAEAPEMLMTVLRQLRHPLWSPQAPKGFDDTTGAWADPDALLNRAELARTITRRLRAQPIDPRGLLDVVDVAAGDQLPKFIADSSIAMEERVALLLAGPAFQWR
jgi:hypothetical protein